MQMTNWRAFWSFAAAGDVAAVKTLVDGLPAEQLCFLVKGWRGMDTEKAETHSRRPNFLHCLCSGDSSQIRMLRLPLLLPIMWSSTTPYQLGQRDKERAEILRIIARAVPAVLLDAVELDKFGFTPVHICISTSSTHTLEVLCDEMCKYAGFERAVLMLSTPTIAVKEGDHPEATKFLTPYEFAIAMHQWKASQLLSFCAMMNHEVIKVCRNGSIRSRLEIKRTTSRKALLSQSRTEEFGSLITETLGGAINRFWDSWGGYSSEVQKVQWHKNVVRLLESDTKNISGSNHQIKPLCSDVRNDIIILEDMNEVEKCMKLELSYTKNRLGISISETMIQLHGNGWNIHDDKLKKLPKRTMQMEDNNTSTGGLQLLRDNSSTAESKCIVCYESFSSGKNVYLEYDMPCYNWHKVCSACWCGIVRAAVEDGRGSGAICPHPDCHFPLPFHTAEKLLESDRDILRRYRQLVLLQYINSHHGMKQCPSSECERVLFSSNGSNFDVRPYTESGSFKRMHMEDLSDIKCSCGFAFCFDCGFSPCHLPASCDQMARWTEELDNFRAIAPSLDKQWLKANAKKCPGCGIQCQKNGGCLHMQCPNCRLHWCWQCSKSWDKHSSDTGGFYACILEPEEEDEAEEYSEHSSSDRISPKANSKDAKISLHSSIEKRRKMNGSWLNAVVCSIRSLADQEIIERSLRMYISHEYDAPALHLTAIHMQNLLEHTVKFPIEFKMTNILEVSTFVEGLGISVKTAASMSKREWSHYLLATSQSCAEYVSASTRQTGGAVASKTSYDSSCIEKKINDIDIVGIGKTIAEANQVLQSAAAVLHDLPGGVRRKYLLDLCNIIEVQLHRLEAPLLMLPCRSELLSPIHEGSVPSNGNVIKKYMLHPFKWILKRLAFVSGHESLPNREPQTGPSSWAPRVSNAALLVQSAHVFGMICEWSTCIKKEWQMLEKNVQVLKHAGRHGIFSTESALG